ncbi:hypothetical protein PIB30_086196 [Stylosanthes scabra]|uniref:Uncharacterized protein n=1 Tax=Stylosanthes scabra TaxID=79078 RepID=A0ABU6VT75_9FABA|nr:hypothetical protein [Stylosanthes scabra]
MPPSNVQLAIKDDIGLAGAGQPAPMTCCYSSNNENTPPTWPSNNGFEQRNQAKAIKVMPDFAQVYSFIAVYLIQIQLIISTD